jgi:hypothetical protein
MKKKLTRRSIIKVNTDQAINLTIEFGPGPKPYIWMGGDVRGYDSVSGYIDDKDKRRLKRMVDSL